MPRILHDLHLFENGFTLVDEQGRPLNGFLRQGEWR
jgi:hypothetical protein